MRGFKTIFAILGALVPCAAGAVELDLGIGTELVYDSNVFRSGVDQQGDGSVRIFPTIGLIQTFENAEFDVYYKPTYEAFMTETSASGLTHYLRNGIDYRVNPKTTVELSNLFRLQSVINYEDGSVADDDTTPVPSNDVRRDEFILNDTAFTLTRAINARWTAATDIGFSLFDPQDRDDVVRSKSVSAFQNFNYQMDGWNRFGMGGGAVVQMYDGLNGLPGNDTYIYRVYGSYERNFGESTVLSIQLGPAVIVTDQDDASGTVAPTFPFFAVDDDTTVGELANEGIAIQSLGQGFFTPDTPIPAGSVVVPNPIACVGDFDNGVAPTVLYTGEECFNTLVLRNDGSFPVEQGALDDIRNSQTQVVVQNSTRGTEDAAFSLFGNVSLLHNWTPNLYSKLSYVRTQSPTRGQGATAIADTVSFLTQWYPNPLWDVSMLATYVHRQSPTDLSRTFLQITRDPQPLAQSDTSGLVQLNGFSTFVEDSKVIDSDRFQIAVRAARRLSRQVTVSARLGYAWQQSNDTSRLLADFSDYSAMVGLKYDFDPFEL